MINKGDSSAATPWKQYVTLTNLATVEELRSSKTEGMSEEVPLGECNNIL